jgi:nitrogen fixation NifU-like protein
MSDKEFDFFQDHSRNFLEMALKSDRVEKMASPDGYGKRVGDCGDTVELFLRVQDDVIQRLSFVVDGCLNTTACCNTVAYLAEGKPVQKVWEISPQEVMTFLETLPPDHEHCAELSVGALYLALSNFQELKRATWKKLYI